MLRELSRRQGGSALATALFVIVVLGMMAAVLTRMRVDSSDLGVNAILGTRAELAATTALEIGTYQLYPLGSSSADPAGTADDDTQGGCVRVSSDLAFDPAVFPGYGGCRAVMECSRRAAKVDSSGEFGTYARRVSYFLKVTASCTGSAPDGGTDYSVSRTVYSALADGEQL